MTQMPWARLLISFTEGLLLQDPAIFKHAGITRAITVDLSAISMFLTVFKLAVINAASKLVKLLTDSVFFAVEGLTLIQFGLAI